MSFEADVPATGTPEVGADSPSAAAETPNPSALDPASGSDTPAEQPGPVPYERFAEVTRELRELREYRQQNDQFSQYFHPDDLEVAKELGLTPGALAQLYAAQRQQAAQPQAQAEADPDTEFEDYLEKTYGDGRYDLSATETRLERKLWDLEQRETAFRAQQEQAQQQARLSQFETALAPLAEQNPILKDPGYQDLAREIHMAYGAPAEAVAEFLLKPINAEVDRRLAQYQQSKSADAAVPVTAGGGSPPPMEKVDFHGASPSERRAMIESRLNALQGSRAA